MENSQPKETSLEKTRNTAGSQPRHERNRSYLSSLQEISEINQTKEKAILPYIAPEGTNFIKIDIITQDPNTTSVKTFMAYLADRAGYLKELYQAVVREANIEIDKQRRDYKLKLAKMRKTKNFKAKLKVPPERVKPDKNFLELFEEFMEMDGFNMKSTFRMKIDGRWYEFNIRTTDAFSFERIQKLPDAVMLFVDADEKLFEEQFVKNVEIKRAMIMHLFFGTQKIFFMYYFDYLDQRLRHLSEQKEIRKKIDEELKKIFDYLGKYLKFLK